MRIGLIILGLCLIISCSNNSTENNDYFGMISYRWTAGLQATIPQIKIYQYFEINNKQSFLFNKEFYPNKDFFFIAHLYESDKKKIKNSLSRLGVDTFRNERKFDLPVCDEFSYCFFIKEKGKKEKFFYFSPWELKPEQKLIFQRIDSLISYDTKEAIAPRQLFYDRFEHIKARLEWQRKDLPKKVVKFTPPKIQIDKK